MKSKAFSVLIASIGEFLFLVIIDTNKCQGAKNNAKNNKTTSSRNRHGFN